MEVTHAIAALVTGAGGGIGRAITLRLAQLGANVTVVDISEAGGEETVRLIQEMRKEEAAQTGDRSAIFVKCDVACPQQLVQAFAVHMDTFHRLDICINNAGIVGDFGFLLEPIAPDQSKEGPLLIPSEGQPWTRMIDINLKAVVDGVGLAVECMDASKVPRGEQLEGKSKRVIVNVASAAGLIPIASAPVYAASKAGVIMLSRTLAHLQEGRGIRVCAFCPLFVETSILNAEDPAVKKLVIEHGGLIPMGTIVEGIMKLIKDDGNGGSVMEVTPGDGYFYATFKDYKGPDIEGPHSGIAAPKPGSSMASARGGD